MQPILASTLDYNMQNQAWVEQIQAVVPARHQPDEGEQIRHINLNGMYVDLQQIATCFRSLLQLRSDNENQLTFNLPEFPTGKPCNGLQS